VTDTPNLKLERLPANTKAWAERVNDNFTLIDAAIGAYFTLQNMQGIWENSHTYTVGETVVDGATASVWRCQETHLSPTIPTTFLEYRTANPTFWSVYSSPAGARGAWIPVTNYAINDFVVSGSQYAVALSTHTSGTNFAVDVLGGRWSILVDLSAVGAQVLPVPGGAADASKIVSVNSGGTGYTISPAVNVLTFLGASSLGTQLLQTASQVAARTTIGAQIAGSYQPLATFLSAISGLAVTNNTMPYTNGSGIAALASLTTFARSLLDDATAAASRTTLGLGTAAIVDTGISSGNVPVLDGSGDLAVGVIPLIALTTMVSDVLPRANGGFTPTTVENILAADVALGTLATYFTGPTVAQGTSGTWFVTGHVNIGNASGGDIVNVKLWDGITVIASCRMHLVSVSGTYYAVATLSGVITSPAGNLRISVSPVARTEGIIKYNASGNSCDSRITAMRIG